MIEGYFNPVGEEVRDFASRTDYTQEQISYFLKCITAIDEETLEFVEAIVCNAWSEGFDQGQGKEVSDAHTM